MTIDTSILDTGLIGSGLTALGLILGHVGTLRGIGYVLERLGRVLQRIPGKATVASVGAAVVQEIADSQTATPTPAFTPAATTPAPVAAAPADPPTA